MTFGPMPNRGEMEAWRDQARDDLEDEMPERDGHRLAFTDDDEYDFG